MWSIVSAEFYKVSEKSVKFCILRAFSMNSEIEPLSTVFCWKFVVMIRASLIVP
jgi:hypothetical protein